MSWLNIANTLLLVVFAFVSLLLIGVILIQKGKGGGLASAFGGGSGTATAFGSKTGDILTWATSIIFGVFLLTAIFLNLIANHQSAPADVIPVGGAASPSNVPASSGNVPGNTKSKGDPMVPPATPEPSAPVNTQPPAAANTPTTRP